LFDDPNREFVAVVNDEGQYSLWPADRAPPAGWTEAGGRGPKADCLAFIEQAWTDMRPRSLREAMGG
jgi:MbtH protein